MLIFDRFPNFDGAFLASADIHKTWKFKSWVCETQEESDQIDPFPFQLTPPILLVESNHDDSAEVKLAVACYGGSFAGT